MIPLVHTGAERELLHGVRQIVRFNWPFYVSAGVVVIIASLLVHQLPYGALSRAAVAAAAALVTLWTVGSLVASWMVYDHSPLMKGDWIAPALGFPPRTWINIHSGFDETTVLVETVFAGASGRVFDMFDPVTMTEPSIARARGLASAATLTEPVDYRRLPAADASVDAITLLLSAHELRSDENRCALLEDVHRILTDRGRVIFAEHLRDVANFVAFGPGFLHFHSRRTWMRCFARAGFAVHSERSITPFVRIFVLEKHP